MPTNRARSRFPDSTREVRFATSRRIGARKLPVRTRIEKLRRHYSAGGLNRSAGYLATFNQEFIRSGFDYVPIVDRGAYEHQCAADLDGDGQIALSDRGLLLSSFGLCRGDPGFSAAADIDGDCCVSLPDLVLLLARLDNRSRSARGAGSRGL